MLYLHQILWWKNRTVFSYDAHEAGVDYSKGKEFLVEGTHTVLATEEELARWTKKDQEIAK